VVRENVTELDRDLRILPVEHAVSVWEDFAEFVFGPDLVLEMVPSERLGVADILAVLLRVTDLDGVVDPVDVLD
jgi:hypothetical protein